MAQPSDDSAPPPKRPSLRRRALRSASTIALEVVALSVVIGSALVLGAYGFRKEVARELAENWLRGHGVESAVTVERIDSAGFTGSIRLGPTADPDLVADRIEVVYDLSYRRPFKLTANSVKLVRPRFKAAFDGEKFTFGKLSPLIDELLARPKTDDPAPDILVEAGQARLATPYGQFNLTLDGAFDDGALTRLEAGVAPTKLEFGDVSAQVRSGRLSARGNGEAINAVLTASLAAVQAPGARLPEAALNLKLDDIRYDLADGADIAATGNLTLTGPSANAAGYALMRPALTISAPDLTLKVKEGKMSGDARGQAVLTAAEASGEAGAVEALRLTAQFASLQWSLEDEGMVAGSPLQLAFTAGRASTPAAPATLTRVTAGMAGRFDTRAATQLSLAGQAEGRGSARLEGMEETPEYGPALARALDDFAFTATGLSVASGRRGASVQLADLRLSSASGAKISLAGAPVLLRSDAGGMSGGLVLNVEGGDLPTLKVDVASYAVKDGAIDAQATTDLALDIGPAKGLRIAPSGSIQMVDGAVRFTAAACMPVAADRLILGETTITAPSGELCPDGALPLIESRYGGFRISAQARSVKAGLPDLALDITEGAGRISMAGQGDAPLNADIALERARIRDTAEPLRFLPVVVSGPLKMAQDQLTGDVAVATPGRIEIARIALRQDLKSGAGTAHIDASRLSFAEDGLQPVDLSPLAEPLIRTSGPASFVGDIAWTADQAPAGTGRLSTTGLNFTSPVGPLKDLKADIALTSLFPLSTAPNQQANARLIEAFAPLTDLAASFQLNPETLALSSATISALGGKLRLEPLTIPVPPDAEFQGVIILDGVELGQLLDVSNLGDKVSAQATLDGRLPFAASPTGFRFLKGSVTARGPGRLAIKREALTGMSTGEAAVTEVNAVQDFAYQAMENLAFDQLDASVESLPGGRLGVIFHIKGKHDPEIGEEIVLGLGEILDRSALTRRLPLPKGTPIDLTLDTSLNFDELLKGFTDAYATVKILEDEARSAKVQPAGP